MLLASMVSHAWSEPGPGCTNWQAPATHGAPFWQAKPQLPQLAASAVTSFSQPLLALPSQSPKPTLHCNPHAPFTHAGVALAPPPHGVHEAAAQPCAGSSSTQAALHIFWPAGQPVAKSGLPTAESAPPPAMSPPPP